MRVTNTTPTTPTAPHRIILGSQITEKGLDNLTKVIIDDLYFGSGNNYIELPGARKPRTTSAFSFSFLSSLLSRRKSEQSASQDSNNSPSITVKVNGTDAPLEVVNGRPTVESLKPHLRNIYGRYIGQVVTSLTGGAIFDYLVAEIDNKLTEIFQSAGMFNAEKYEYAQRRDKSRPYDRDNVLNPVYLPWHTTGFDYDQENGYFLTGEIATQFTIQQRAGQIVIPKQTASDETPIIAPIVVHNTEESQSSCLTDILQKSQLLDIAAN